MGLIPMCLSKYTHTLTPPSYTHKNSVREKEKKERSERNKKKEKEEERDRD